MGEVGGDGGGGGGNKSSFRFLNLENSKAAEQYGPLDRASSVRSVVVIEV